MSLAFKTLFDTVTLDGDRRVVIRKEGEVPFQDVAAVEVSYSPPGSYASESYPVHIRARDGSRIEIANDAFGVARRAAVSAAETLAAPIHDLSFGKLSTASAEEWSVPLRERLRGRVIPVPGLKSPGEDLLASREGDAVRFDVKPGAIGRAVRRVLAELRAGDAIDWTYTLLLTVLLLIPCLLVLPFALAIYFVSRTLQGRPLLATLTVSPAGVQLGGGIVAPDPIAAEAIQDVALHWQNGWRGRSRLQSVAVRSDDARLEFILDGEAEGDWVRQHVLAALARTP